MTMLVFDDLTPGDRFMAVGSLWTKLDGDAARKHGPQSIELGADGFGYIGDPLCSFERNDPIDFVPVEA